jgi:hypothetical protein
MISEILVNDNGNFSIETEQHPQFGFVLSVKNRKPFSESKLKNGANGEGVYYLYYNERKKCIFNVTR